MEITQAEAARILGVSGAAIAYALKSGRIKCEIRHGKKWIERNGLEEKWGNGARRMPPDPRYRGEKKPLRSLEERLRPRPEQQPEAEQIATVPVETVTQKQSEVPDYNESRARTEYLKAELMEFDRAEKEGELIRADEVTKAWGEIVAITRTKMMAVPTKAKQRIPEISADDFVVLEEIVREALEELSNG